MTALSADTHASAEAVMIAILRRMTPTERLYRSFELRESVLTLARARIRRKHPNIARREEMLRLASLWLDAATMRRVWGWDPTVEGH